MSNLIRQEDLARMILDVHAESIEDLKESLKMYIGKGDDKKPLISTGLKLQHKKTGLIYTVLKSIIDDENGICIVCEKPQGGFLKITCDQLKQYERL